MSWKVQRLTFGREAAVVSVRHRSPNCLDEHPNAAEIRAVVNRALRLRPHEITALAAAWRDNRGLAAARDRALSPDAPLVVEVLATFETIDVALFGRSPLDAVPNLAAKAIRDTVAAAYARPILKRGEYRALAEPWRRTFPTFRAGERAVAT